MSISDYFKQLSKKLKHKKAWLWGAAVCGLSFTVIPFSLIILEMTETFWKYSFALGTPILIVSWGLICMESWFAEKPQGKISKNMEASFPKFYGWTKGIFEWYASIFLVLWFIAGLVMPVIIIMKL